ncbi:MAG: hypothetical protein N4Q32_00010 [Neisseriaceae bacterium]|nr:hypothetical protein [Neisseriaceae bacterium]
MKKYVILLILFLVSCSENMAGRAGEEHKNKIEDSYQNFFKTKEYENSYEEKKCIDNSNGDFYQLSICSNNSIKTIKSNIKKKLEGLNKSEKVLDAQYEKIKAECTIKILEDEDFNGEDDSTKNSFIASCIKIDLYQFGRNLK